MIERHGREDGVDGYYCEPEDVDKLEQAAAQMAEALESAEFCQGCSQDSGCDRCEVPVERSNALDAYRETKK